MLLVDLGGGSCEITLSEHKRIKETISVPLGAVRLTEEFLQADPPPAEGLTQMRRLIARELRRAHRKIEPAHVSLVIATSGHRGGAERGADGSGQDAQRSWENRQKAATEQRDPAGPSRSERWGLHRPSKCASWPTKISKMALPDREAVPGIGPRRAEIIVAGAQVFAELLESFALPGFRYSPLGLRDGILAQMLAEQDARAAGPSRVRARTLGERASHGATLWRRSAAGRAGASPRAAAFPRTEGAA